MTTGPAFTGWPFFFGKFESNVIAVGKPDKTLFSHIVKDGVALDLLRPIEQLKIECGKRHFKNLQFKTVKSLAELIQ